MTAILDVDAAFGVELRLAALEMAGQRCFGENEVQSGQNLQVDGKLLRVRHQLTA